MSKTEKKPDPTIEELGKKLDPAVFAGVCVNENWKKGKTVSKADFDKAVKKFLESSIDGKEKPVKGASK